MIIFLLFVRIASYLDIERLTIFLMFMDKNCFFFPFERIKNNTDGISFIVSSMNFFYNMKHEIEERLQQWHLFTMKPDAFHGVLKFYLSQLPGNQQVTGVEYYKLIDSHK